VLNIGWFSTGRDEAARQLLQAVQDKIRGGDIDGAISFVFCNREPGESKDSDLFFELVRSYNIPIVYLSHKEFKAAGTDTTWRIKYDREVNKKVKPFAPDLCVLAGYMLIVSPELCLKYNMINLHPAPPGGPAGSWQEVIWTLIQDRADTAGTMMHLVTPELDKGPVVTYCLFTIKGRPFAKFWRRDDKTILFQLIRKHELAREFPLITLTLQSLSRGEVSIKDRKVIDAQGKIIKGYDLSAKIDQVVEGKIS
jgi:folate-dependent phosphoribosylglycinamide formyltransferase PurN